MRKKSVFKQPQANLSNNFQSVFKPLELKLEVNDKVKVVSSSKRTLIKPDGTREINTREIKSLISRDITDHGDGLISLFKYHDEQEDDKFFVKPKLLVCITCYNETKSQMEDSLSGVLDNLEYFKEAQIGNHQVVVVVIYDGIDKLNDVTDNDKSMMVLFDEEDRFHNIPKERTMKFQKKQYEKYLFRSKLNVDKMSHEGDVTIFKKNNELNEELIEYFDENKLSDYDRKEERIKIDFLYKKKAEAQVYLNERKNTAWVYQARRETEQITSDDREGLEILKQKQVQQKIKEQEKITKQMYDQEAQRHSNDDEHNELLELGLKEQDQNYLYMFYCVRNKNGGKLSSHLWFFSGFCELFNPDYTVLMDCGLKPGATSLFNFYLAMEADKNIGGTCGFMGLKPENVYDDAGHREDGYDKKYVDSCTDFMLSWFNIQYAQVFEYDMAHIIDKPFESLFDFIHVLPGAFSGYRWLALKRQHGESVLDAYLKTVLTNDFQYNSIEEANMYLAEDRILCLNIYARFGHAFKLQYIPSSTAVVDPVTTIPNMMGQRRRWINGTWFALEYVLKHEDMVYQSNHTPWEIFKYRISMYYAHMMRFFTYITIGMVFSASMISVNAIFDEVTLKTGYGGRDTIISFPAIFTFTYVMLVLSMIFYALNFNHRNDRINCKYYCISTFLGLTTLVTFTVLGYLAGVLMTASGDEIDKLLNNVDGQVSIINQQLIRWMVIISFGLNAMPILFNLDRVIEILESLPHYIYFSPIYIHTLLIFAFCRIDDLSWGTKGLEAGSSSQGNIELLFKWSKFVFVTKWVTTNTAIIVLFAMFQELKITKEIMIYLLGFQGLFVLGIRSFGALLYYLWYYGYFYRQMRNMIKRNRDSNYANSNENKAKLKKFFTSFKDRSQSEFNFHAFALKQN